MISYSKKIAETAEALSLSIYRIQDKALHNVYGEGRREAIKIYDNLEEMKEKIEKFFTIPSEKPKTVNLDLLKQYQDELAALTSKVEEYNAKLEELYMESETEITTKCGELDALITKLNEVAVDKE